MLDNLNDVRDLPLASVTNILFSERMTKRLREWRDGLLREGNGGFQFQGSFNNSRQQLQTIFYKMRPALCLSGFTSHQLKLIQMVVKKHFKDLAYVHVNVESSCLQQLVVCTESEDDKDLLMKQVKDECREKAEMKIKDAVGFRHVIDLLSSAQKLIVGHNCFLDIAHIYSKFFGPLPLTAEEFVASVNKHFPHIVDTKILLNANDVLLRRMKKSRTSLSSAFRLLCPEIALGSNDSSDIAFDRQVNVEVQVDDTRFSKLSSGVKHEAGYDAFMTGCVFAQACSHLGIDFDLQLSSDNLAHNEKLQKHVNLLYLSWFNGDIINLRTGNRIAESLVTNNIKKRHTKILFENIVLIWRFPSTLKASEIRECICKVFGQNSVTSIYKVDETAVLVQFSKSELVSDFLVLKEELDRSNDVISVFHPLSKLLEGGNTCAAEYETYKEICSSPFSKVLFADQAAAVGIGSQTKLVESKVVAQSQEQETAVKKSKAVKQRVIDDLLSGQSSCTEVIDSFYIGQVKQIGATNL
ncbi:poly(A)-specific ribonuclease PARN isoform X2 [Jatropha curcas]|nr:poly(A)-specific ribonuclease PARN isoform X2 [Jatropha curcas]